LKRYQAGKYSTTSGIFGTILTRQKRFPKRSGMLDRNALMP